MIDIRHLRYFRVVAEELHFGRSAARICIAQPALSRQIQQLEDEIGTRLLKRTRRQVELTAAGRLFLERTNMILAELSKAAIDCRRVGDGELGRLSVGFIHSSTYGLLPSIIERFRHLYPDIELELHEMSIPEQHVALTRDQIDIGLLRPQKTNAKIEIQTVMEDPFWLAVSSKHPLAKQKEVRLRECANESMILFAKEESPLFHSRITAMCERAGFTPKVVQSAMHIHTVVGLVGTGIGIAIVPGAARNLNPKGVCFIDIVDKPEPVHIALAWQKDRETPAIRSFRQVALMVAQQMQSSYKPKR